MSAWTKAEEEKFEIHKQDVMNSEKAWEEMEKIMESKGHLAESTLLKKEGCFDEMIVLRTWEDRYVVHNHTPQNKAYYWGKYFDEYKDAWNYFLDKIAQKGLRVHIEIDSSPRL